MDKHSQAIGEVYIGGHVINHWLVGSVQTNIVRQSVRCILEDMLSTIGWWDQYRQT